MEKTNLIGKSLLYRKRRKQKIKSRTRGLFFRPLVFFNDNRDNRDNPFLLPDHSKRESQFSFHIAPFFRKTHFLEALKGPLFLQPSTTFLAHLQHAPFCLASSRPMKKQSRYFYLFSFIKLRNKKSDATKITCFSDKYKQSDTKKRTMPFMAPLSKKAEQDVILRTMAK